MKTWQIKPKVSDDLTEQLLFNRGLKSKKEIEDFFHPQLENYEKDLELAGIAAAKKRILQAVKRQELIIVFGDYDVDGTCGTAILYHGLTALGAKVLPYIPHREKEGYGLSKIGLQYAKDQGASLVITVDNGIVALEPAKFAKSLGLDLIITDHHVPLPEKPGALAIIHSTKICGAAVGWCLIRKMVDKEQAEELLDLVAIATIGDMIPLVSVNRSLVYEGLKVLNTTRRPGLQALIIDAHLKLGQVDAHQISHMLGPRLNAIGRLEHALDTVRLLCTKDTVKARRLSQLLCETNDQKKKLTIEAVAQAKEMIASADAISKKRKILILHSPAWIPGIIGLVAARVAEEYRVPAVVISEGEVQSKGSARSLSGLDIIETIRSCADTLLDVGGHPKAAGFTVETARIPEFKARLEKVMDVVELDQAENLEIEAELPSKLLTKKLLADLLCFEPTGMGNPKPLFATMNMRVDDIRTVGNGQHLKLKVDGLDAIAFSLGNLGTLVKVGQLINVAFYPELDSYNGADKLQLKVVDLTWN